MKHTNEKSLQKNEIRKRKNEEKYIIERNEHLFMIINSLLFFPLHNLLPTFYLYIPLILPEI